MKKELIGIAEYTVQTRREVFYYLMTDMKAASTPYGVCVVQHDPTEFACMRRVWADRDEAVDFISRLCRGVAMPVTLRDLVRDYEDQQAAARSCNF